MALFAVGAIAAIRGLATTVNSVLQNAASNIGGILPAENYRRRFVG